MISLTRRTLLASASAALVIPALPRVARAATMPVLFAGPATAQIAPDGNDLTDVWAYGSESSAGTIPGPEIRVRAGERVQRRLSNGLPQPTAVHWHGIRIDNAMDGAAGLTQDPVQPGDTFDYDFIAPDPGTYWYHSHDRSWEQVARGLAGPLIVEEAEPWTGQDGAATREMTVMLTDWRLEASGAIEEASFGDIRDWAHGGRLGNVVTVNGRSDAELEVNAGERLRLRLINAATARIMPLRIEGHDATLIALDGHPVAPRATGQIVLAPAQRADIVIDCTGKPGSKAALMVDAGRNQWVQVAALAYSDTAPVPAIEGPVRPLPMTMDHALDLKNAQREEIVMEGGAMGSMRGARLNGVESDFRELVAAKRAWAFNGIAGDMENPAFRAPRGRTVHVTLRNDTSWPHGIHLHGHHFEILTRNGQPDAYRDRRDTVFVAPEEVVEIAFNADNPGKWLLHCHMLGHQVAGMRTWFEVG